MNFDNKIFRKFKLLANHDGYSSLSVALEWKVFKKALMHRPKIIHFWFADHDYHYASHIAKLIGAKIVGNFFFSIEEFERRIPDKSHLEKLDLITASGKKQMEYLSSFYPEEKIAFLPLGIDTKFYHPLVNRESRVTNPSILLHVGNNRRDFKTLKDVFIRLQKQIPEIKLEMVGYKNGNSLFNNIKNVTFHPFVSDDDLLKLYQESSLLILPLLEGGSSQTLNEAMATGLPIVTNDLPNLEDYISKEAVFLSPPGDSESMASHCSRLLKQRKLWEESSHKAQLHAKQFDFQEIRKKIIDIYREYLGFEIIGDLE